MLKIEVQDSKMFSKKKRESFVSTRICWIWFDETCTRM